MEQLQTALQTIIKNVYKLDVVVVLTRPDEKFGDFATNAALQLAKPLGKNPREVAETLAVKLRENCENFVKTVDIAGPGFINITVQDSVLINDMQRQPAKLLEGQTVIAEYSDPNPFKVLHAGHLYTTIVGNAIANLAQQAGARVVRINFGGDVGLHVGKTLWAIKKELDGWNVPALKTTVPENIEMKAAWLSARYVEGTNAYEDDELAKTEIIALNKQVYELHNTADFSSDFGQTYSICRDWSYDYFKHFYDTIQVTPFDRFLPESETAPVGLATVLAHKESGVYTDSDGATVFEGEAHGLHTRVFINSNGLPTYEAKDVGLLMVKWRDYAFDQSIIITGNDIVEYMKVVLKSVEQFEPEPAHRTRHITHGQVKLAGGVKMSSRKGNILGALDIIETAADAAKAYAESVGNTYEKTYVYDAFKYAFLKNRIGGDVIYDPEESVAIEGNSGPYLQYAHARARSILVKNESTVTNPVELVAGERSLARKLCEFSEVIELATKELMPHHICTYLYELAQVFNRFYEHNRVISDPRQAERLSLVQAYADTLKQGMTILGISAPDRM